MEETDKIIWGDSGTGNCDVTITGVSLHKTSQIKEITIKQLDYGYTVKVDCSEFAFETKAKMLKHLAVYLDKPLKCENYFNKTGKLLSK